MRAFLLMAVAVGVCWAQPTISTAQADNSRQAVVQETSLTRATVANLTRLATIPLSGGEYGQVLYIPSITVGGKTRNVIFAADATNSVYAFDADSYTQLWKTSTGETPCTSSCSGFAWGLNYDDPVGILSTPVEDVANGWLFFVTLNNTPVYRLWKVNLLTGAVIGSALTLTSSVSPSAAADAVGGVLTFSPSTATQRSALTVANGNVYIPFSSQRDVGHWHGWAFARRESDLSDVGDFCSNWNQDGGGFWMAGGGFSVLPNGNLIAVTGNGGTDSGTWISSYTGVHDFSMSILQFSPSLGLVDWYTPADYATQNSVDADLGSSHAMLVPNPASPGNSLIVTGGKDYNAYAVHSECMGHLGGTVGGCPGAQRFGTGVNPGNNHSGIYGDMFMNGVAYFPNTDGNLFSFTLLGSGSFNTTPTVGSTSAFPGAMLSGSINGASNGIVWAVTADSSTITSPSSGELVALDPVTLGTIWSSATDPSNALGQVQKFVSPTVANGKVYVPLYGGGIAVYGIPPRTYILLGKLKEERR